MAGKMNSLSVNRPLTRPPATLSPIGGEGRGEGAVRGPWSRGAILERDSRNHPRQPLALSE